jgi:predicted NAD-dependent protein-ADP-ribosyltransferase YbiA (DUF1768 family)
MKVRLKEGLLVLTAEQDNEIQEVSGWIATHADHAFRAMPQDSRTILLRGLGPHLEACREPINVSSRSTDEAVRLISNFAYMPFSLHGRTHASVEGFWQGLKFPDDESRLRIAQLHGLEAKQAGAGAPEAETVVYEGRTIRVGTYEHWGVMYEACWAKFTQHGEAQRALLGTGARPLTHRSRRDSRTIPGVIMADIWMRIRTRLMKGEPQEER